MTRVEDLTIEEEEAALRYLLARSGSKPGQWFRARTCAAGRVVVRVRQVTEVEIAVRGEAPEGGDLYRIGQALMHLGLVAGEPEHVAEPKPLVRIIAAATQLPTEDNPSRERGAK